MKLFPLPFFRAKADAPRQVISDSWSEREVILSRDNNLFCWRRPEDTNLTGYLSQLIRKDLENIRAHLALSTFDEDLDAARARWDASFDTQADEFWKDVSILAKDFLHMSSEGAGTLHLRVVKNDACTKFHLDGYDLRLFTTYYGPGTEWLPEKAVNRSALGKRNELIVKSPELIQRMQTYDVAILKGERPNQVNDTPGIVHRSPAILKTGGKRIIMRLDI